MKVLNLYAGIGGNRKLWYDVEVTAVEYNEEIAAIYQDYFPNDKVIVTDAHEYLLHHYKEFDFIWTSPPCPTHSRIRMVASKMGQYEPVFPDIKLWQEIIFLDQYFDGKYVVENVIPYYVPLIIPTAKLERHLFWSNFKIRNIELDKTNNKNIVHVSANDKRYGYDLNKYKIEHDKVKILRNLVNPELGLYILDHARGIIKSNSKQPELFFSSQNT